MRLLQRVKNLIIGVRPAPVLKRPENEVDYSLLDRLERKRRELEADGVQPKGYRPGECGSHDGL